MQEKRKALVCGKLINRQHTQLEKADRVQSFLCNAVKNNIATNAVLLFEAKIVLM